MLEGALSSSGLTGNTGAGKRSRAHATFICCLDKSLLTPIGSAGSSCSVKLSPEGKATGAFGFGSVLTGDSTRSWGVRILCELGSYASASSEPQQAGLVQPHKRPLEM